MNSDETVLQYAVPKPSNHKRSTFSLICSGIVAAMQFFAFFAISFITRIPHNWFLSVIAIFAIIYGLAFFMAGGFAILAIIKEKPRRRAVLALAASVFIFLIAFALAQYVIYLEGVKT